jgi:alpha-N-acetylglucosaminidase
MKTPAFGKGLLFVLLCLFVSLGNAQNAQNGNTRNGTAALEALVARQLPFHNNSFIFHLAQQQKINIKTHAELDTFTLFDRDGKVHIECSTISACARGLYTCLPNIPLPIIPLLHLTVMVF